MMVEGMAAGPEKEAALAELTRLQQEAAVLEASATEAHAAAVSQQQATEAQRDLTNNPNPDPGL